MNFKAFTLISIFMWQLSGVASAALDTQPFSLVKSGNKVCKVEPAAREQVCYQSVEDASTIGFAFPSTIEIVSRLRVCQVVNCDESSSGGVDMSELDKTGGAILISKVNRDWVIANFKSLSVRDIAVDVENIKPDSPGLQIPFVATIDWAGSRLIQGTIYVEGTFDFKGLINLHEKAEGQSTAEHVSGLLANSFGVDNLADSGFLQQAGRVIKFKSIYGIDSDVDAATVKMVKEIVGPFVVSEVIFLPIAKGFVFTIEEFATKLIESLAKALKNKD